MMHHHEPECLAKRLVCIFKVRITAKVNRIKIWQFLIFWAVDPFATKLGVIIHFHKLECLMNKFDCLVQGRGHSKISKCQWMFVQTMSSEPLPNFNYQTWYISSELMVSSEPLPNFNYQTWYGDASSWARSSLKKIGLLSSRSRSQGRIITQNETC